MTSFVVLAEDAAALDGLEPVWWDLWRRCPGASPFTSPAWLMPWWRAFAPGPLRAAACFDGDRLVALAPLWLKDGALGRRLLPLGIGISDDFDLLCDPSAGPDALHRVIDALAARGDWDSLGLEQLAPGASALGLAVPDGWRDSVEDDSPCPVLALAGGVDPLACVPAGQRRKIRMARHRTARRGGQVRAIGSAELPDFLETLCRLHAARWAERGEGGVLADERVRRFHADALPRLDAAGLLHATTLTIEGRDVAAYYGLRSPGRAYAYLGGFDPAHAFESPGTVLLAHAVEAATDEGAAEFHFLRGREPYKYAWGGIDRLNRRRILARPGG